jgi:hypothetical protein
MYLKPEDLDLLIEVGKTPSQIKPDDALYYQNCLFAGLDKANKYWPIGHVIKDGKYYQKYYKELPWSAFIIPFEGRPYVGQIQGTDYKLAFLSTPGIKKDGKVFINSKAEECDFENLLINVNGNIPHYRYMQITLNDNTKITFRPDAGIEHGWFAQNRYPMP